MLAVAATFAPSFDDSVIVVVPVESVPAVMVQVLCVPDTAEHETPLNMEALYPDADGVPYGVVPRANVATEVLTDDKYTENEDGEGVIVDLEATATVKVITAVVPPASVAVTVTVAVPAVEPAVIVAVLIPVPTELTS